MSPVTPSNPRQPDRAPPFLPLLLTLSRRLRRTSLQGNSRSSDASDRDIPLQTDEEEEIGTEDEEEFSGVRRLANIIETRSSSSASEASEDEGREARRHSRYRHITSDSGAWEKWGLKPQHTGSGLGSCSDSPSQPLTSPTTSGSSNVGASTPSGPSSSASAPSPGCGNASSPSALEQVSPPPPYCSQFESPSVHLTVMDDGDQNDGTPRASRNTSTFSDLSPDSRTPSKSHSARVFVPSPMETSPTPPEERYTSLQSKLRRSVRNLRTQNEGELDTRRKEKPRPSIPESLFSTTAEEKAKTERERELEEQLADVLNRVKSLENRLSEEKDESGTTTPTPRNISSPPTPAAEEQKDTAREKSWRDMLALTTFGPDGARSVPALPAYLLLVGVGAGAVVLRLALSGRRV